MLNLSVCVYPDPSLADFQTLSVVSLAAGPDTAPSDLMGRIYLEATAQALCSSVGRPSAGFLISPGPGLGVTLPKYSPFSVSVQLFSIDTDSKWDR